MPQKIKILGLSKPEDYIQKEFDVVDAYKAKLLRDSDWTQTIDCPLRASSVLLWRFWRTLVRDIAKGSNTPLQYKKLLEDLESKTPTNYYGSNKLILTKFDHSSFDNFKTSCILIAKEFFGAKSEKVKMLTLKLEETSTMDGALTALVEVIDNGY